MGALKLISRRKASSVARRPTSNGSVVSVVTSSFRLRVARSDEVNLVRPRDAGSSEMVLKVRTSDSYLLILYGSATMSVDFFNFLTLVDDEVDTKSFEKAFFSGGVTECKLDVSNVHSFSYIHLGRSIFFS